MDDLTALDQTGLLEPGNVQQLQQMDQNEMARKLQPTKDCATCGKANLVKKMKDWVDAHGGGTVIQQNNVGMSVLTYTQSTDLMSGAQYSGLSVNALPDIGYNSEVCGVIGGAGDPNNVITGFGATASLSAGPGVASIGGNPSGVIACVGAGGSVSLIPMPVTPNLSAGYTWQVSPGGTDMSYLGNTMD